MAGRLRRCIACGRSEGKAELLRFVLGKSGFEWDPHHTKPGRGGYVHPRVVCWSRMSEVKRWRLALRCGDELTRESLIGAMDEVRGRIEGLNGGSVTPGAPKRSVKL